MADRGTKEGEEESVGEIICMHGMHCNMQFLLQILLAIYANVHAADNDQYRFLISNLYFVGFYSQNIRDHVKNVDHLYAL